jgi:2-polyprenyl-3-methyl-5-hydroxy-6-metoxy-1,4-benzoquinol methylase
MLKFFFPNLSKRSSENELMDLEFCDEKKLINTVKQFSLLNYLFSNSRKIIKKYIFQDMLKSKNKVYQFLDIGSGGCDIAVWFLKLCRKNKLKVCITCIDNNDPITKYAQKKCSRYKEIKVIKESAFNLKNFSKFDYIFANHFLHHLDENNIIKIIDLIAEQTNKVFLLNDLKRSNPAYLGYTLFTGVFLHKSFAFYDGRMSIRKGFSLNEFEYFLNELKHKNKIKILQVKPARIIFLGQNK